MPPLKGNLVILNHHFEARETRGQLVADKHFEMPSWVALGEVAVAARQKEHIFEDQTVVVDDLLDFKTFGFSKGPGLLQIGKVHVHSLFVGSFGSQKQKVHGPLRLQLRLDKGNVLQNGR